jgi:hypothetical protein
VRRCALAVLVGCAPLEPDVPASTPIAAEVLITTVSNDYAVGSLSVASTSPRQVASDVASTHSDAVVSWSGGAVWVINRLRMDTVRRYALDQWQAPELEVSTGEGSNPHDVEVCGGRAYVSLYERDALLVLDPVTGEQLDRVSLVGSADDDGLPEASDLVVLGDRLYVGLQRMRRTAGWVASEQGEVVELDCASGALLRRFEVGANPVLRAVDEAEELYVVSERGLERVALAGEGAVELVVGAPASGAWVDGDVSAAGVGVLIGREGSQHTIACVRLEDGAVEEVERLANYLSSVRMNADGEAWVAARQGWEDPSVLGGLIVVDAVGCVSLTGDAWVRPNLAPFDVEWVR